MLKIFTDTDCDVTPSIAKKYGFHLISMPYVEKGELLRPYESWDDFDPHEFYERLRHGELASTCALAPTDYVNYFEPIFAAGDDILYVHFSAEMTSSFNAMRLALEDLKEKYPERKFYEVDTKLIAIPALLMVEEVGKLYQKGATAEEIMDWCAKEEQHFALFLFADDLKFFGRSGRVSGLSAVLGNVIGIKPIISMNPEGKLVPTAKARGTKNVINKILDNVERLQDNMKDYPVLIANTDCDALCDKLIAAFTERFGEGYDIRKIKINPTIGAHCGPDTTGIAFHAKARE